MCEKYIAEKYNFGKFNSVSLIGISSSGKITVYSISLAEIPFIIWTQIILVTFALCSEVKNVVPDMATAREKP